MARSLRRRELLELGVAGLAARALPGCVEARVEASPFTHGVASGDPASESVLLWTRVATTVLVEVEVRVYADPTREVEVLRTLDVADPSRDGCVRVVVDGLIPDRAYFYEFFVELAGVVHTSELGRTRTLPTSGVDRRRFAVVTCSNFAAGYFHAFARIAERADLSAVVHLGDSIYEYAEGEYGGVRPLDPTGRCWTLADYRRRHAWARSDAGLRACLRQHPLLVVWDDHEFANNACPTGAPDHDPMRDGPWSDRRDAARRAFFEWMPVRGEPEGRERDVARELRVGDLARLLLLDTRMEGRDPIPIDTDDWLRADRRLVSDAQEAWIAAAVERSDVVHTVLANQVVLAPFLTMENLDSWDGFPAQQARVIAAFARAASSVVVLTGDAHAAHAFDLPGPTYDAATQAGAVGVEWVVPAVSSPPVAPSIFGLAPAEAEARLLAATPHLRWTEQAHRGYGLLDLDAERARFEVWFVEDVERAEGGTEWLAAAFESRPGDASSRRVEAVAAPALDAPPRAP